MVSFSERQLGRRWKEYGDWSNIASDLLEYIEKMLPFPDILRCRYVCRHWRSVTKTHLSSSPLPPLLLCRKHITVDSDEPTSDDDDVSDVSDSSKLNFVKEENWCFIDVQKTDGGNLYIHKNKKLEQLPAGMVNYVGYSHGYFLFSDRKTLYLFHPTLFSGSLARLPVIKFPDSPNNNHGIKKAILWADPISCHNDDGSYGYGIVAIQAGYRKLFFANCGETQFSRRKWQSEKCVKFVDIICIRNCIYAITEGIFPSKHYLKVWDCNARTIEDRGVPRMLLNFKPRFSSEGDHIRIGATNLRLVELQDELFLVVIRGDIRCSNKIEPTLNVYKMNFEKKIWVRMTSLGDYVLFMMEFQSMFLSSSEFPQYERNSIYFSDYFLSSTKQPRLGIFNMEDGSIKLIEAKRKC